MKRRTTTIALATAGTLLAGGPLALAATHHATPTGGKIQVFVSQANETKGKVTFTGAIGDYGTIVSTDKNGKVDPNGVYQHATLKHGTMVIDATGLDNAFGHLRPTVNKANCSVTFSVSGPSKIISGTGDYAGATGTVRVTATFAGIAAKKASGACNLADNAPTYGAYTTITGGGTVSFK